MDQSITNVVDINPIQILLTSLLEFKQERRSRNISSILKGYVVASVSSFTTVPSLSKKKGNKARFRSRTFHEPNLIRIKADPNCLDCLN